MFDQSRTFDGAGNVTSTATTMPGGTDNQSFCYDEQDRLTWASAATATPPCGGSNTAGTLTAAQYTQTFTYDVLGRLTGGPLGSYTYGSSAHMHAATGIGNAWTAAYDAAGNMTCRAPSNPSTCAGTQTGAQLAYNNEGELQSWQNAPSSPTTTAQFLYDGQGQRVEQSMTQSSTTTTTVYVGDVEEVSTSGGTTTTTAYYYAGVKRIGLSVNGAISYLASDGLGSATVTLSSSGSATAAELFAPYGGVRYSSGTMPTSYGFTGQRSDTASGLDYYGARYYDPLAGQFTSGDTLVPGGGLDLWGLSRYAYVGGNPIIRVDPTGHDDCVDDGNGNLYCGSGDGGGDNSGGGGGSGCLDTCVPSGTGDPGYNPPPPPPVQPPASAPPPSTGPPPTNGSPPSVCDVLPECAPPPPPTPAPDDSIVRSTFEPTQQHGLGISAACDFLGDGCTLQLSVTAGSPSSGGRAIDPGYLLLLLAAAAGYAAWQTQKDWENEQRWLDQQGGRNADGFGGLFNSLYSGPFRDPPRGSGTPPGPVRAVAIAIATLIGLLALGGEDEKGKPKPWPTPSPSPTPRPTPSSTPPHGPCYMVCRPSGT
jgi:RHS repeat-associated protein